MSHSILYVTLYLFVLATMYSVHVLPFGFIYKVGLKTLCLKRLISPQSGTTIAKACTVHSLRG
jgi:hypothetical protein